MIQKIFLFFCFYLPFQIALNPAEGIDLASGRIFIFVLVLLWIISALKNCYVFIPAKIQTAFILSFLFLSGMSLFWAENMTWGIRKFLFLLSIFPIYFVTAGIFKSHSCISENSENKNTTSSFYQEQTDIIETTNLFVRTIKCIIWGAGLAAIIGIIQFFLQFIISLDVTTALWRNYITPLFLGKEFTQSVLQYPSWAVAISGKDYLRAFGTFPDPHMFSFYLGLALPLALGLYFKKDSVSFCLNNLKKSSSDKRKIYLIISIIIFLADLLTFSRGGYIGLISGLIFTVLYFTINNKISFEKKMVVFILFLTIIMFIVIMPVGQRFISSFSAEEGSNKIRFENWQQAIEMIKNNFQGVGIGNYSYEIEPSAEYRKPIYAHNLYLDIAAETGIINSLIFILLLAFSIHSFIVKAKSDILYFAGAVSLIIFSVHSFFDTALYSVQVLPLLLIIIVLSLKTNYTRIKSYISV